MSVDLPAPFCPTSAWTSPASSEKSTSKRTRPPGKSLVMARISNSGAGPSGGRETSMVRGRALWLLGSAPGSLIVVHVLRGHDGQWQEVVRSFDLVLLVGQP